MADKIKQDTYFVTGCRLLLQQLDDRRKKLAGLGSCGYTLVELVVVVGIIAALAMMAVPSFREYVKTAKNNACASDLRIIDKAVTAYYIERNVLPANLTEVGMNTLLDPWKNNYVYHNLSLAGPPPLQDIAGAELNTDYDLYCKGEDGLSDPVAGVPGNEDDIARANDGYFIGGRP
ncbi:MAG TPA: prepilin-type N-terminal cleavage/methylation domain-containing protein [Dongiaceae bacterium]|nr:prepilin-type N-terminal cleavage/methylation domain-containing protein [Dongiaceae bacterium]